MKQIEILKARIAAAGGVSKLAREIGVRQNTLSNWLMRGSVPAGWAKYFETTL